VYATATASYQPFVGQITCPQSVCGNGEQTAEHLLFFSTDITDVFLVEFLVPLMSSSCQQQQTTAMCLFGMYDWQVPDLKDAESMQRFFLQEVQLGEELLAAGLTCTCD